MTSDPARHLADVGARLLDTLRPIFEVPVAPRLPGAYRDVLIDPVALLSGVCEGLLETQATPAAPKEEDPIALSMGSLPHPGPRERDAAAPRFHHDVSGAEVPDDDIARISTSYAQAPVAWREAAITNTSSFAGPESHARSAESIGLRPDPSARRPEDPAPPETGLREHPRPAIGSPGPDPRSALVESFPVESSPADGSRPARLDEPTPSGSDEAPAPARRVPREVDPPEAFFPLTQAGSDRVRKNPARDATGPLRPGAGVRLTSDAGRLAAVLGAHTADPTAAPPEEKSEPLSVEDGGPRRDPVGGRIGVEEVVEKLADELETAFVRAYGSSGV